MKLLITVCTIAFLLLAQGFLVSSAQAEPEKPPGDAEIPDGPASGSALVDTVELATDWVFIGLLITASIYIVLAGFQFVTGGGDPTAVSEARRKLLYAAVAVVVGALARGIPLAVRSIVGG